MVSVSVVLVIVEDVVFEYAVEVVLELPAVLYVVSVSVVLVIVEDVVSEYEVKGV